MKSSRGRPENGRKPIFTLEIVRRIEQALEERRRRDRRRQQQQIEGNDRRSGSDRRR